MLFRSRWFRAAGTLTLVGDHAVEKGHRCGQIVLDRLRDVGWHYTQTVVECLGNGESVPVMRSLNEGHDSYETVLRIAVESPDKDAVEAFSKEMIPLVTAGPQGTTGYAQGRPSVQPVFRYWPCLIDEKVVPWSVDLIETASPSPSAAKHSWPKYHVNNREKRGGESSERGNSTKPALQAPKPRRLKSIAYGRSGDKGIHANIGILVRDPADYAWLCKWLTSERVHDFFRPMGLERVERFEAPNLCGINFLLYGVLNCSIRNDAQGKALAQALLTISIPDEREV